MCLKDYSWTQFRKDLLAGIVVGLVALPLAMAFAIASGVPPERGLYTAIVAGFLISVFGGSRVQIGGPTGAFVVIVSGIVGRYGYDGLALATLMAGIVLILMVSFVWDLSLNLFRIQSRQGLPQALRSLFSAAK